LELLVATILSAQSTDVRVNMVTPEIFKKYPTWRSSRSWNRSNLARRSLDRLFSEQIEVCGWGGTQNRQ